jgi:hypothetical protein
MAATTNANRGLRLDDDALGEAQPRVVTHRGLQYPGEVIVAETVNPDWVLPLDGDRLTSDVVREIRFSEDLADGLGVLRTRPQASWNAALHYATVLDDGLGPAEDDAQTVPQEQRLIAALRTLGARVSEAIAEVPARETPSGDEAADVSSNLDRLQLLCEAGSYEGFLEAARSTFGGPSTLRAAMEVLQRLERLAVLAPGIAAARKYLDGMTFDAERGELRLARDSLAARAAPADLLANPSLWDSIEAGFTQLRRDYGAAYAAHHVPYHGEAAALATRLENLRPRVAAVARLNDVPEFGGPLGSDVPGRFGDLVASLKSSELGGADLALEDAPYCGLCSLSLDEEVPQRQAERIIADLDAALREYNRRLSSEAVTRILAHPTREQLDRFIDLMRVSDLTELANVLDERVVEFLRGFVSDGRPGRDAAL